MYGCLGMKGKQDAFFGSFMTACIIAYLSRSIYGYKSILCEMRGARTPHVNSTTLLFACSDKERCWNLTLSTQPYRLYIYR